MLYGGIEIHKQLADWLEERYHEHDGEARLVYAACANSFPQGISRYDSDYDLHVLRYGADRELRTEGAVSRTEIHSIHPDVLDMGTHARAHIELIEWNDVDLFSVLVCPEKASRRISATVYYILYASLNSPYTMDPFGIIPKILPLCASVCDLNMILAYFKKRADSRTSEGPVSLKQYMSRLHSYLSMLWISAYGSFPPLDIRILMKQIEENDKADAVYSFYLNNRRKTCDVIEADLLKVLDDLGEKAADFCSAYMGRYPVASENEQIKAYEQVIQTIDTAMKE